MSCATAHMIIKSAEDENIPVFCLSFLEACLASARVLATASNADISVIVCFAIAGC